MMHKKDMAKLSAEGRRLLSEPTVRAVLTAVAASVGVTAEEYLLRFEEVMAEDAESVFAIFESNNACTENA